VPPTTPLVERERAVEELRAALARSRDGGEVILLEGPAGIGKSRLLEALRGAAEGFEVLWARGGALEQDLAFGVVRQLLERRLAAAPAEERDALLGGGAAAAARVLGLGTPPDGRAGGDMAGALHGLAWAVANLADRRPLLLVVDDLHWSDRGSLEFLAFLARRVDELPACIVIAVRDGEPSRHDAAVAELAARASVVRPAPLSPDGVAELMAAMLGAPAPAELVAACHAATGGNPFFLGELLAAVAADGGMPGMTPAGVGAAVPSSVARSILLRLGRLTAPARRLAAAAAVLGEEAALRHALALAEVTAADADAAADALVRAGILASIHPVRFEHPMLRAAIAGDASPADRAAAHRRAAALLHADLEPAERIAPHLLASPPAGDPWAVPVLRSAGGEAMRRGAPDVAVRLLRRAAEEPPGPDRAELLGALGAAELANGDYAASAAAAGWAIEVEPDGATRARLRLLRSAGLLAIEGAAAAMRSLEDGLAEAGAADAQLALLLETELGYLAGMADVAHPVARGLGRHRALPGDTHPERAMLSLVALEALRADERASAVRDLALRGLGGGRLLAEDELRTMAYYAATLALIEAEAYEDARTAIADAMADVVARGSEYGFAGICWLRGILATRIGDLAAAEADERTCAERAVPTMVGIGASSLALVLLEQGDVAAAHRTLEDAGLLTDRRPLYVWGPYVRGLVRLAQGRPAEALADLRDVGRHTSEVGGATAGLPWQAHAALALEALGEHEAARAAADAELERARRRGSPRLLGIALRARGLVAHGMERTARLTDAVDALERSEAALELARARADLGVALLRDGQRRAGRELLERSHDAARRCGARGLAQATHDELRVAGARPRRMMFSGVESLTASERRVAEMAADGLSNREIAQALFVTPKTVGNQLGHVYAKLAVSSRRALPAALGRVPAGEG
jgi:DNA-binding CsgD family transcriptional regulator